ncbi:MAG: tetratricopeptide repeat protein [Bacteroidetes bacterium]|nr:tetratricopeptide repeat protein [Bacteroidota bacterium]
MKKAVVLLALVGLSTLVNAQNKNIVSAINYFGYFMKDKNASDLAEAKKYIDLATEHEETKTKAKMWINRAQIYQAISDSKDEKAKALSPNPLEEAAKAYQQTIKYDEKKVYTEAPGNLMYCANSFLNTGVAFFNEKNYGKAVEYFEKSIQINKESFNKIDSNAIFNASLAADRGNMTDKAKLYFQQLIDMNYGGAADGARNYSMLAAVYNKENNTEKYLATIAAGRKAFPNDKDLIIEELNFYLKAGKDKEALANLDLAIKNDPTNQTLHFALGTIYDKLEQYENAEAAYKKAIEIKPDYFDALYNLGALYFNRGAKQTSLANDIKDDAKYRAAMVKVDDIFKQSLPYLEKAEQVGSEDKVTFKDLLNTLKSLYARTEQTEKMNAIKEKLKNY